MHTVHRAVKVGQVDGIMTKTWWLSVLVFDRHSYVYDELFTTAATSYLAANKS